MKNHYDIVVLGAGPGGYIAALKGGQLGAKVAIIESGYLGGTCLNVGCIPSKALLASAELLHKIDHGKSLGVTIKGKASFDWPAIQKRKDKVISTLRGGIAGLFKSRKVELIRGKAAIAGIGKVTVTADGKDQTITADKIIIATGSTPVMIPGWPADREIVCTSDEALHWAKLPKKLLIVGGGVIGCEFACMMKQFGVAVTVVEMLPELLPTLDVDLGSSLRKSFKKRKITCHVSTRVDQLDIVNGNAVAKLSNGETVEADKVLVATGRRANTEGIGLETVGIKTDRSFVQADDMLATSAKDIYCIGDANGKMQLAHSASAQGEIAVKNALGGNDKLTAPTPWCVYTFPEIAGVGLTESQVSEQSLPVTIGRFPIGHLGKAMAVGETEGFVKVIRHRETDALLGVHMIGHNVTEIVASACAMLTIGATTTELAEVVFAHPTISEAVKEAAGDALGEALHLPPRKTLRLEAGI